jgi:hydrogenase maturation factor HypF (carbamoyltransferase family)
LQKAGLTVLFNRLVPANDGGVSLGQAAIAAKKMNKNKQD